MGLAPMLMNRGPGAQVRRFVVCMAACFATMAVSAQERVAPPSAEGRIPPPSSDAMEEVEVTGERPGPNLWRVSNGDHVVWLMGTLDPLPKGMTWRSRELESVLKEVKQVVPSWPDVDVSAGPITLMRTWFVWRKVQKLPDNQTLKDWLPPDLYSRWNALKARYEVRGNSIDKEVPVLAAMHLYWRALEVAKLAPARDVERTVLKLTRKNKVRITQTELKVKDPREVVTQFGEIPRDIQVRCLAAIVARLERDMDTIKAQADAWAAGDVETLRKLPYPQEISICTDALETSGRMKDMIDHINTSWNRTIEGALTNGPSTLAVKPIYDLLGEDGVLARLRAKGYQIEGP
jgi:uncharacterized protein YbaP (TraB family)